MHNELRLEIINFPHGIEIIITVIIIIIIINK